MNTNNHYYNHLYSRNIITNMQTPDPARLVLYSFVICLMFLNLSLRLYHFILIQLSSSGHLITIWSFKVHPKSWPFLHFLMNNRPSTNFLTLFISCCICPSISSLSVWWESEIWSLNLEIHTEDTETRLVLENIRQNKKENDKAVIIFWVQNHIYFVENGVLCRTYPFYLSSGEKSSFYL